MYSDGVPSVPFLSALNLFLVGDTQMSKNVLNELYYNLTLQVLSEEHTEQTAKFQKIGEIQKAVRSNKLKREKDNQTIKI